MGCQGPLVSLKVWPSMEMGVVCGVLVTVNFSLHQAAPVCHQHMNSWAPNHMVSSGLEVVQVP